MTGKLQVVRERQDAEVVTEWSSNAGGNGQHGTDTRYDRYIEAAPHRRSLLESFADRRRHAEYSRIAAGYHCNAGTFCRGSQGLRARSISCLLSEA